MAKSIAAGFIKGFTGRTLDSIDRRRELENEEKKARMLAALQQETAQANFLFEQSYKKKNSPSKELSSVDYDSGRVVLRNDLGEEIGTRELTAAEREDRASGQEKERLGLENIRSQITSRDRNDARLERSTNASIDSMKSKDKAGTTDSDEFTVANELIDKFKSRLPAGAPPEVVHELALASVRTALRTGGSSADRIRNAQERFLFQLENLKKDIVNPEVEDPTKPSYDPGARLRGLGG